MNQPLRKRIDTLTPDDLALLPVAVRDITEVTP
jgi:hypothetical protein